MSRWNIDCTMAAIIAPIILIGFLFFLLTVGSCNEKLEERVQQEKVLEVELEKTKWESRPCIGE